MILESHMPKPLVCVEDTHGGKRAYDKCPWCDKEVKYLQYHADVREHGTCELDGTNLNTDAEDRDGADYECPHCFEPIIPNQS